MESILDTSKKIIDLIKDTPEYKNYLKSKEMLEKNTELKDLYLQYRETLSEIYINNKFSNVDSVEPDDLLYVMYEELNNNPITKEYMMYEEIILGFYKEIDSVFRNEIQLLK